MSSIGIQNLDGMVSLFYDMICVYERATRWSSSILMIPFAFSDLHSLFAWRLGGRKKDGNMGFVDSGSVYEQCVML
jgi:hypothetical protein